MRLHRHLPAVRLVSRHFPPLHVALCRFNSSAAPISRFVFAVRCVILAPMDAIWFRAEYRPSPSGAPWRSLPHPVKSESLNLLSLFVLLCRASCRVIPDFFLRRYRALLRAKRGFVQFKPEKTSIAHNRCKRQGLRRFSEWNGSTTSAGKRGASTAWTGDVERGGIVQTPQMCADMVTGGIPP